MASGAPWPALYRNPAFETFVFDGFATMEIHACDRGRYKCDMDILTTKPENM